MILNPFRHYGATMPSTDTAKVSVKLLTQEVFFQEVKINIKIMKDILYFNETCKFFKTLTYELLYFSF